MPAGLAIELARPVDAIADAFVDECAQRYPETATYLGVPGNDDAWSDYSPDGFAEQSGHLRRTIAALHSAAPTDDRENIAKEAMLERLGLEVELYEAHITTSRVSVIGGQAQEIRAIFDLMPNESEDAWRNIATRLRTVETPLDQVRQTLAAEARDGNISAVRQIKATIEHIRTWTGEIGDDDFFAGLVAAAPPLPAACTPTSPTPRTGPGRRSPTSANWFGDTLAPLAPSLDAVGEERYALDSRYFLGAVIDLEDTYQWGFEELHRIQTDSARSPATWSAHPTSRARTRPSMPIPRAGCPARRCSGTGCRIWPIGRSPIWPATTSTSRSRSGRIECCIAPTHDGSIYYTDPAEDFSRPGQMWWAVPAEIDTFSTWKEVTTVYHEGVPGHHLQIAQNAYRSDLLNRWQRKLCFCSGHGEGWALYAERLMDDLGFLEPGDRMGMLDAQAFRAVRVIIDIGMHLQLRIPPDNAWKFRPGRTLDARGRL